MDFSVQNVIVEKNVDPRPFPPFCLIVNQHSLVLRPRNCNKLREFVCVQMHSFFFVTLSVD